MGEYFPSLLLASYNAMMWLSGYRTVGLWMADFPWPMPHLWLTGDHFVGKASAIDQPTRPTRGRRLGLYIRLLCGTKAPLQLRFAAFGAI